jgi:hypothetical protein
MSQKFVRNYSPDQALNEELGLGLGADLFDMDFLFQASFFYPDSLIGVHAANAKLLTSIQDQRKRDHLGQALLSIVNRPYWHRAWTLQELLLPPSSACYILCGSSCGEWSQLSTLVRTVMGIEITFTGDDYESMVSLITAEGEAQCVAARLLHGSAGDIPMKLFVRLCANWKVNRGWTKASRSLDGFFKLPILCSDIRDRVYAMLSLVDEGHIRRIHPDYNLSQFQVARVVMRWHFHYKNPWSKSSFTEGLLGYLGLAKDDIEVREYLESPEEEDLLSTTSPKRVFWAKAVYQWTLESCCDDPSHDFSCVASDGHLDQKRR